MDAFRSIRNEDERQEGGKRQQREKDQCVVINCKITSTYTRLSEKFKFQIGHVSIDMYFVAQITEQSD